MNKSILPAALAIMTLVACGQPRHHSSPPTAKPTAAPTPAPVAESTPVPPPSKLSTIFAQLIGPDTTVTAETVPSTPSVKAETVHALPPSEVAVMQKQGQEVKMEAPEEARMVTSGSTVTAESAAVAVAMTPEESGLLTNVKISATGPDGKCSRKFFDAYWMMHARLELADKNVTAALDKMQSLRDDGETILDRLNVFGSGETSADVQGRVVKDFATLRSTTLELKQTFGRTFACNDERNKLVISGDPHFARFAVIRARVGKLIGAKNMGNEI